MHPCILHQPTQWPCPASPVCCAGASECRVLAAPPLPGSPGADQAACACLCLPLDGREAIEALAASLSFPLKKLFVVDGSRRSAHSNAYQVAGRGGTTAAVVVLCWPGRLPARSSAPAGSAGPITLPCVPPPCPRWAPRSTASPPISASCCTTRCCSSAAGSRWWRCWRTSWATGGCQTRLSRLGRWWVRAPLAACPAAHHAACSSSVRCTAWPLGEVFALCASGLALRWHCVQGQGMRICWSMAQH